MLDPATQRQLASRGRKAREALARRDDDVRAAIAGGATLREVGQAVGMSHAAIARIVTRANPGRVSIGRTPAESDRLRRQMDYALGVTGSTATNEEP